MKAGLLVAALAVGCSEAPETTELRPSNLKANLETLARARIYFGHQSVGNNVLEGLAELATQEGVALRIVEAPEGLQDRKPAIVHAKVGRNRFPSTKCDAFSRFLREDTTIPWDAAILKFCYADLGEASESNPQQLIELYERMVLSVRAHRPGLLLVHATMPLLSEGLGKRDAIRKLLGLGTSNDAGNVIRNEFNDLLRGTYSREPLFDVAWAESTRPDGTRAGFRTNDRFTLTVVPEFTYDEGHLTPQGRQWVAREFARSLATALRQRSLLAGEEATPEA